MTDKFKSNVFDLKNYNENLIIIPARGGSKGIKNKNLYLVNNKPLLYWVLCEALKTRSIFRVIVSTDDIKISNFSKKMGADVMIRPKKISGDESSSESALLNVLDQLSTKKVYPKIIVFLQCTSPLIDSEDIERGIKYLQKKNLDSTFAATLSDNFLWKKIQGKFVGINHNENKRLMRQKRESEYLEAGSIYIMKTSVFLKEKYRFCGRFEPFLINKSKVLDINDYDDIKFAEKIIQNKKKSKKIKFIPKALIMDFDGVHTNNKVYVDSSGKEFVVCSRSDGLGLKRLQESMKIKLLILTNEGNKVVQKRAEKLGVECIQSKSEKKLILDFWLNKHGIFIEDVIFIGNDVNDLECVKKSGISCCPSDADAKIKNNVDFILKKKGGEGVIRELTDLIIMKKND